MNEFIMTKQPQGRLERLIQAWPFSSKPVVSVLRIHGALDDTECSGVHRFIPLIDKAFSAYKLQAVALVINSVGGELSQAELLSNRIRSLADEHQVRVYSFIEGAAISAGYMVACAGDEIYALNSSLVGVDDIASSLEASRGDQRFTQQDVSMNDALRRDLHSQLLNYIKLRRGVALSTGDKKMNICLGQQALALGMIDGIGDLYAFINSKFGQKIRVNEVMSKTLWLKQQLHK